MYAGPVPAIESLECPRCHRRIPADSAQPVCPDCSGPLLVRYGTQTLQRADKPATGSPASIARYTSLLPDDALSISLGEGWTPLLPSRRHAHLLIKDEAANPSGSIHARRAALVVSMALHRGHRKLAAAATGDEGVSLAAYAAAAGIEVHLFLPRAAAAGYSEILAHGASVTLIDGSLADCTLRIDEGRHRNDWFDITAPCQPFGIEGSKTIGYELVEQLGWQYPAAILCPAGDQAALIGLCKAFEELEQIGWVSGRRPQLILVRHSASPVLDPPNPLAPDIARASGADTIAVSDEAWRTALLDWAHHEGILLCPQGAAAAAAWDQLHRTGQLPESEPVALIQPASGIRHIGAMEEALGLATKKYPRRTPVGGIIIPQ